MTSIFISILLSSLLILSLFWVIPWINIVRYKKPIQKKSNPVSVIVCAHNELSNLQTLIPLLEQQDHPDFEIIIVDDRSEDGTYDFMLGYESEKVKHVRVDSVHDHISAKKYAITLGVKAASHDLLLFTDADCRPNSNLWVQEMTNTMDDATSFSIGVSQYLKQDTFLNKIIRFETQQTAFAYIGSALSGNPYMGVGRNLCYRKSLFLNNNGFNKYQHVIGGDDDILVNQWGKKKNTQVVLGTESIIQSIPKKTWNEYFSQKVRHISVSKFYRAKDKMLIGFQNLLNIIYWCALYTLAVQSDQYYIIGGAVAFRILLLVNLNYYTSKKFGDRINIWFVPLLDIIYVWLISIVGLVALFTKKVKWK